ncbi:MAG TPA: FAD-dependent oxidoreductase [Chthoniobacterales bacterium]|jgi:D-amino-acid oxidase
MKNGDPPAIAVIGAGVSGLTCAVAFAEREHPVTIFASETGEQTTSAAAAAIWFPYDAEPVAQVVLWALATYQELRDLARDSSTGVSMIELRTFSRANEMPIPHWAVPLGARPLIRSRETKPVTAPIDAFPSAFTNGFSLRVPLTDTTRYLDYLRRRFTRAGGRIEVVQLKKIEDVSHGFKVIVNCAGIGARELTPDPGVEPHRGQVAIVGKLDLPCAIVCDDPPLMYAIPRENDCVFGGTNSVSARREPIVAETESIVGECSRILNIQAPAVIATRVGLRPYRKAGVRVESERLQDGRAVIHNYGHGGSGFTLSWGCAQDVIRLSSLL